MSGTEIAATQDAPEDDGMPEIPNFSVSRKTVKRNGENEEWLEVKYGTNATDSKLPAHVLDVRNVDMGDQFDLAEIAGANVDNGVWLSLAIVAMSVQAIDGVPEARMVDKKSLRNTLVKIGPLGVRAVRSSFAWFTGRRDLDQDGEQIKAAAGN